MYANWLKWLGLPVNWLCLAFFLVGQLPRAKKSLGGCERKCPGHLTTASMLADTKDVTAKPLVAIPDLASPFWDSRLRLFYRGSLEFPRTRAQKLLKTKDVGVRDRQMGVGPERVQPAPRTKSVTHVLGIKCYRCPGLLTDLCTCSVRICARPYIDTAGRGQWSAPHGLLHRHNPSVACQRRDDGIKK